MSRTAAPNLWLGDRRGFLTDWATQVWVRTTGRRTAIEQVRWLDAPAGSTQRIGEDYLQALLNRERLTIDPGPAGLVENLETLRGPSFDPDQVHPSVRHFYEHTTAYTLSVRACWTRWAKPLGRATMWLFARRLQQLNLPLNEDELHAGTDSAVLQLRDVDGVVRKTVWQRRARDDGRMIYLGLYDQTHVPNHDGPCLRTWFPLPNGGAAVLLRPTAGTDGSMMLHSDAQQFGDPGFYFVVQRGQQRWVRMLRCFHEDLHVFMDDNGTLRTNHRFRLFGRQCIHLHYKISRKQQAE